MASYTPQEWRNGDAGTPLSAARLLHIENGIAGVELTPGPKGDKGDTGAASTVAGPKGDKGDDGAPGGKGSTGAPGADGFPSESQWNDLVARVEALEV